MAHKGEKDAVVDFAKYCDQKVRVKFQGGREVEGVLKGYDKLDNLVLDETIEFLRDDMNGHLAENRTRMLGLVICRGTQVSFICPCDEMEEIANPFAEVDEDEDDVQIKDG